MNKKENNTYAYDDDYEDDNINDKSPGQGDEPDDRNMVGNGQIQNDLVDKEVEQVIMKNTNNPTRGSAPGGNQQKASAGGYALPGDDDEGDGDEDEDDSDVGIVVNENVNPDDLENQEDEEDDGVMNDDEEDEADVDAHDG